MQLSFHLSLAPIATFLTDDFDTELQIVPDHVEADSQFEQVVVSDHTFDSAFSFAWEDL